MITITNIITTMNITYLNTLWTQSAIELYRPRDRRLSAKLAPTSVDIGCHVVNVTDPYGRILGVLDPMNIINSIKDIVLIILIFFS
jgi:hypothetical protein